MKNLLFCWSLIFVFFSCKNEPKEETKPLSVVEKIANAHGFEQWNKVSEVQFTFKVDVDTIKGSGRTWVWKPQKNIVSFKSDNETFEYNRSKIDSTSRQYDRSFTNDKFWAFIPFQLVWDKNIEVSEVKTAKGPISNADLQMISIVYPNIGGYTPGEAYDIYFDNDYMIREWSFRKSNAKEPMLSNTFEKYHDFNGIKIAINHLKNNGKWNLNFADVKVSFQD